MNAVFHDPATAAVIDGEVVAARNEERSLHRADDKRPMSGSVVADDRPVEAVLFDRDGTLIVDIPYNGDPTRVQPLPGAREVLAQLRTAGVKVGVVTNQSGVGRGLITAEELILVNERVAGLLGSFDTWQVCPHRPEAECECRKPAPGLVIKAAADLGVPPEHCVVIGDIGSDVKAARAANAGHVLVPTSSTAPEDITDADITAADLEAAVDKLTPYIEGAP